MSIDWNLKDSCKTEMDFLANLTVMHQCKESLFHQQLSVEDNQLGTGWYEIVAFMELEELDENLILVI